MSVSKTLGWVLGRLSHRSFNSGGLPCFSFRNKTYVKLLSQTLC
nr:MAG TPA: hypothetical protein [Caudoviricetes sp.]